MNRAELVDPFAASDYERRRINSPRAAFILTLDTAVLRLGEAVADLTDDEYQWEPIERSARASDLALPPEQKQVWRVYNRNDRWYYDYPEGEVLHIPYTTIGWLLNHIASTADMYLYCIQAEKAAGIERVWDDIPVPPNREAMSDLAFQTLEQARKFLCAFAEEDFSSAMNQFTPAPWGELRPTFVNLWGGVIEHTLQHAMQIAARKDEIRTHCWNWSASGEAPKI